MGRKYGGQSICDSSCRGCKYYGIFLNCCEYMLQTEQLRPCPAGKGCTVRTTKRGKTMAQQIDADAYSYLARKEKEDRLSVELRQSDLEGVSYGVWKSGQPVVEEVEEPHEAGLCIRCGKPIIGRAKNAKYCGLECRDEEYKERDRITGRNAEKNRRYLERKKLEAMRKEQAV